MATGNALDGQNSVKGSEEDFHIVCVPCYIDGDTIAAFGYCCQCKEHLCASCFRYHKKPRPTRHHILLDKDDMPGTQDLDTSIDSALSDNLTTPCPRHKNKMLKLFCYLLLLCGICVALEYTKQCQFFYIPETSEQIINSKEYNNVVESIDTILTECESIKDRTSEESENSNSSPRDQTKPTNCQDQTPSTLTQQQKQMPSTSDQHIGQVTNESNSKGNRKQATSSSDEQPQGEIEAQPTATSQQAQPTNYHIQAASTSSQQQDKTNDQIKPKSKGPDAASSSDQQQGQPTPTSQQAEQIQAPSQNQVGDQIKRTSQNSQACDSSNRNEGFVSHSTSAQLNPVLRPAFDNVQATRQGEMYVRTSEDMWDCGITGITTLLSGRLVLVDRGNDAIKLVDIDSNKIISRLTVKSPWDITATSSSQVAVTVPHEQEIQFITATDKLSLSHKVNTNGKCYSICYFEDILVVIYINPGKLEIMNMQGKVMTSVQIYSTGENILSGPNYVQANSNYIYVSDHGMRQVIMLNWQGEITGRIGGMGRPEGLTLLHDGSLLVCDCLVDKVYHVSGDGTNKRAVLAGVRDPQAICVDDGGHTLYISRWTPWMLTEEDNNILVYKL